MRPQKDVVESTGVGALMEKGAREGFSEVVTFELRPG